MLLIELLLRKVRDLFHLFAESEGFYIRYPHFPIFFWSSSITSISKIYDVSRNYWYTFIFFLQNYLFSVIVQYLVYGFNSDLTCFQHLMIILLFYASIIPPYIYNKV